MTKTWFITGSSRGFGREWATVALERGDNVTATARDVRSLAPLAERYRERVLALALDVTDRAAAFAAVAQAHEHFGRIDVVVNNAGYGLFGAIEEISEEEARAQLETNLFGALWVTQAAIPYLASQRSGHIIQVSSVGGIAAFAGLGLYHASKWGLEGFTEALSQELSDSGVNVTLIEPSGFDTEWGTSSAVRAAPIPRYEWIREQMSERRSSSGQGQTAATGPAILRIVDADQPPLRVFFGSRPLQIAREHYEQRLRTWEEWQDVSIAAQGD